MYTVMSVHSQLSRYAVAGLPPAFQRQCQMEGFKCLNIISTAPYTAVSARVSIGVAAVDMLCMTVESTRKRVITVSRLCNLSYVKHRFAVPMEGTDEHRRHEQSRQTRYDAVVMAIFVVYCQF